MYLDLFTAEVEAVGTKVGASCNFVLVRQHSGWQVSRGTCQPGLHLSGWRKKYNVPINNNGMSAGQGSAQLNEWTLPLPYKLE